MENQEHYLCPHPFQDLERKLKKIEEDPRFCRD